MKGKKLNLKEIGKLFKVKEIVVCLRKKTFLL